MDNFFFQNNNSNNYSRTYSKGKSFKFSVWNPDDVYNNDEYIQDFVGFNNSLWACVGNNIIGEEPNELSGNWNLITKGLSNADILQVIEDLGIIESNPFEKGDAENSAVLKGGNNIATANYSTAFGLEAKAKGEAAHAEGYQTKAYGGTSHAEGYQTGAGGGSSHAEGQGTEATGLASHAEGYYTDAKADYAHAEGQETRALSIASHAEGYNTEAKKYAHAEGNGTFANGESSHAEGLSSEANGVVSHAEGRKTFANGEYSHSEGRETEANGKYSHAEGFTTITYNDAEHASGRYNNSVEKTESNTTADATLFSIGIGDSKKQRKNAFEVKQNGDIYVNGIGNYDGSNSESAKSLKDVIISWTIL